MKKNNHHIIPEVVLRRFTDNNSDIYRIRVHSPYDKVSKPLKPGGVGYEKNFYEIEKFGIDLLTELTDSNYVENVVNQHFENKINSYWPLLEENRDTISVSDKIEIAQILIHLRSRSKYIREAAFTAERFEEMYKNFRTNFLATTAGKELYDPLYKSLRNDDEALKTIAKLLFNNRKPSDLHNTFLINQFNDPLTGQKEALVQKHVDAEWSILRCSRQHPYVIGDTLGFFNNLNSKLPPLSGEFESIWPISSTNYLHIKNHGRTLPKRKQEFINRFEVKINQVRFFNQIAAAQCSDFIFGSSVDSLNNARDDFRAGINFDATS